MESPATQARPTRPAMKTTQKVKVTQLKWPVVVTAASRW